MTRYFQKLIRFSIPLIQLESRVGSLSRIEDVRTMSASEVKIRWPNIFLNPLERVFQSIHRAWSSNVRAWSTKGPI